MSNSLSLLAPNPYFSVSASSGKTYTAAGNGLITGVPSQGSDLNDLLKSGCSISPFHSLGLFSGGWIINGLGDSETNNSVNYQQPLTNPDNTPSWAPSTAYITNNVVYVPASNGCYRCTTGGTSSSTGSGPSGTGAGITDGTAVWTFLQPTVNKQGTSFLFQAELANPNLRFDLNGYHTGPAGGVQKVYVISRGKNYKPTDTITVGNGVILTPIINPNDGGFDGVVTNNPGWSSTSSNIFTINTSTGSGADISIATQASGTFAVSGCQTKDMVARLQDCIASSTQIFTVFGGTNDAGLNVTNWTNMMPTVATATANLRTCYETLMDAGRKVIAITIYPRNNQNEFTATAIRRINRWIRDYCAGKLYANPLGYTNISLADVEGYMADGTSTSISPIGGAGGVAGAMTGDGLHGSQRAVEYLGKVIGKAAERWTGPAPEYFSHSYSMDDGYHATYNPGGNLLEALTWQPNQSVALNEKCRNGSHMYYCTAAGITAGSGGPTGTGTGITDNTVTWAYAAFDPGRSVLLGSGGSFTASSGIVFSGTVPSGFTFSRPSGSAVGTVAGSSESPWSNGQIGQRARFDIALGSGTAAEKLRLTIFSNTPAIIGMQPQDFGSSYYVMEMDAEFFNMCNFTGIFLESISDATGTCFAGMNTSSAGTHTVNSFGEMMQDFPNNGREFIRTAPFLLPVGLTSVTSTLDLWFDASGDANSATLSLYINHIALRKVGPA